MRSRTLPERSDSYCDFALTQWSVVSESQSMNPWRLRATLVGQGRVQIARWVHQRHHQRDLVDALRSDLVADLHRRGVGSSVR